MFTFFFFFPFRTINICLISLDDFFFCNSEDELLQAKSKCLTCKKKKSPSFHSLIQCSKYGAFHNIFNTPQDYLYYHFTQDKV